MKIKKILIVPSKKALKQKESFSENIRRRWRDFKKSPRIHDAGCLHWSDITSILGQENTFVLGKLRYGSAYFSNKIPDNVMFLSSLGMPRPSFVKESDLKKILGQVDVVIISERSGDILQTVIAESRALGVPIVMLEANDSEAIYGSKNIRKDITHDFVKGKDFDLYFKLDVPLGYGTPYLFPLAPQPVRPPMYHFEKLPKDITVFYSGSYNPALYQGDRGEAVEALRSIPGALFLQHNSPADYGSIKDYLNNISRAKLALCPSGRSWNSYRISHTGLSPGTALIAADPYIETTSPRLEDGVNAILYKTKIGSDGRYHLTNPDELVQKVKFYLSHDAERERIASRWHDDVLAGHTMTSHAQYILDTIEKAL